MSAMAGKRILRSPFGGSYLLSGGRDAIDASVLRVADGRHHRFAVSRQGVGPLHERLPVERDRFDPSARLWSPDHGLEDVLTVTSDWCGRTSDLRCVVAV